MARRRATGRLSLSVLLALICWSFLPGVNPVALAAQSPADSLLSQLPGSTGKERVLLLNTLFKRYRNFAPDRAAGYAREALGLARQLGDSAGEGQALNNLGTFAKNTGDLDQALGYYLASVSIQEALGDQQRLAFALSNIGIVYSMQGQPLKAMTSFEEALGYFRQLGDPGYLIPALDNLGTAHYDAGNLEQAQAYYQQADSLARAAGMESDLTNLHNQGNIYQQQGRYAEARQYYFRSLRYEEEMRNTYGIARALSNIGTSYLSQGDPEQALDYLNRATDRAREVQDLQLLMSVHEQLADAYFARDNLLQAYMALQLHGKYKDSLLNEETAQKLAELETRFEVEKKEKEIELLRKEDENKSLMIRNTNIRLYAIMFTLLSVLALAVLIFSKYRQNQRAKSLLEKQNEDIESAKQIIEEKNQDITDSILYARTVQEAIIRRNDLSRHLKDSFVFYRPKDIVSGDFYWFSHLQEAELIAAVDCTGHGVAGAFMTIIGNSMMSQIINGQQITEPAEILELLDWRVRDTLKHHEMQSTAHGMDVALCRIDRKRNLLHFAGAKRPLYYVRAGVLHEVKGSRYAIADSLAEHSKSFESECIPLEPGDTFYLCSDGFSDQFGGPKGKKYMVRRFKDFLLAHHQEPMERQLERLHVEMEQWMDQHPQTDDMLVIGFRVQAN